MNRGREQALLFLRKAANDEGLLDAVIHSATVSDDVFGFHCQQAAEKLLKALLSKLQVGFRRTHDLKYLMDLLADAGEPLPTRFDDLKELNFFAVEFRYDDVPSEVKLDRPVTRQKLRELRSYVESNICPSSA